MFRMNRGKCKINILVPFYKVEIRSNLNKDEIIIRLREKTILRSEKRKGSLREMLFKGEVEKDKFKLTLLPVANYGIMNSLAPQIIGTIKNSEHAEDRTVEISVRGTGIYWCALVIVSVGFGYALLTGQNIAMCMITYLLVLGVFELSFWLPCKKSIKEINGLLERK